MNPKLTFNCRNLSFVPGECLIKAGTDASARLLRKPSGGGGAGGGELFKDSNYCLCGDGVSLQQSLSSPKIEKVKNC